MYKRQLSVLLIHTFTTVTIDTACTCVFQLWLHWGASKTYVLFAYNVLFCCQTTEDVLQGKCTFGMRLSDSEVAEVAQYVWDKANEGW